MFLRVYAHEGKRLPKSFESFVEDLSDWHGMFIEMDGSFVWSFVADGHRHQLDGMVYDREEAVEYLEVKGELMPEMWARLARTLAGDASEPTAWDRILRVHDVARQRWATPSVILQTILEGGANDAH